MEKALLMTEREIAILRWLEDGYNMSSRWLGKSKYLKQFNEKFVKILSKHLGKDEIIINLPKKKVPNAETKLVLEKMIKIISETKNHSKANLERLLILDGVKIPSKTSVRYYIKTLADWGNISRGHRKGGYYEIIKKRID